MVPTELIEQTYRPLPAEVERVYALGLVTGELMHDLANALAIVQGRASLALSEAATGRPHTLELQRLVETSDELSRMLRDVVETLRGRACSPEVTFAPFEVTERVIRRFAEGTSSAELRLISSLPPETAVAGRASFFVRALQNLLGNAMRYARTQIRVRLTLVESPSRSAGGPEIVVEVADDGPGIPDVHVAALFLPLVQGKDGGAAGLGLSSVRWSVEQLGGRIGYHRDEGLGGASFEIRLPAAARRREKVSLDGTALVGRRIALVEDDPTVEHALSRLLERLGADVVPIRSPGEGNDEWATAVLRTLPDVILLDLHLRSREGTEIWRSLAAQVPAFARRVLFLSGAAPGDRLWESAHATGQPVLAKPLDVDALTRAVAQVAGGA